MVNESRVKICVVVGSENDLPPDKQDMLCRLLGELGFELGEISIISAHRNPDALAEYCQEVKYTECRVVFIAIAGMAAALPGAIASLTHGRYPVVAVAMPSKDFPTGLDAVISMVRMPPGTPVGCVLDVTGSCVAIGEDGWKQAALYAAQIASFADPVVEAKLWRYRQLTNKPAQVQARILQPTAATGA